MTWLTKLCIVELLMLSRNVGSVVNSSGGTEASSEPASPKLVLRKSFSSVLLLSGFVRFSKAAITSSSGRIVGLKAPQYQRRRFYHEAMHLQIDVCLGILEWPRQLDLPEDLALAV